MPTEAQGQQEAEKQPVSGADSYPLGLVSVYADKNETEPLAQMDLPAVVEEWRRESPRWIEDIIAAGAKAKQYKEAQELATLNAAFDGSRATIQNKVFHRNPWITLDLDPPDDVKGTPLTLEDLATAFKSAPVSYTHLTLPTTPYV